MWLKLILTCNNSSLLLVGRVCFNFSWSDLLAADERSGWRAAEGDGAAAGAQSFQRVQTSACWKLLCTYCLRLPKGPFRRHGSVRAVPRHFSPRLRHHGSRAGVRPGLALPAVPAVEEASSGQGSASAGLAAEDPGSSARGRRAPLPHRKDSEVAAQSPAGLHRRAARESGNHGELNVLQKYSNFLDFFISHMLNPQTLLDFIGILMTQQNKAVLNFKNKTFNASICWWREQNTNW